MTEAKETEAGARRQLRDESSAKWLNGMYSAALLPTSFNQDTFLEKACEDGGFSVQAARAYVEECGRVQKLTPRSC